MKHGANLFRQTILVLLVVQGEMQGATDWATQSLGWSPRLAEPLFVALHMPVYHPRAFFDRWFSFNACALNVFNRGGLIAASGGVAAIVIALTGFLLGIRRAEAKGICNFRPLNPRGTFRDLMQSVHAVVAPRNSKFDQVQSRPVRQEAYYAC